MPSFLPSFPYPPSGQEGIWSPVTSTLNWCEEDYYATIYSAEVINSFTNLMFAWLAYKGISNCIRNRHPLVFLFANISYLAIGVGSFFFHTTLKYPMQLVDELSMIYTTCILFFAMFSHGRSSLSAFLLGLSISALAAFITGYYHYLQDPEFHQNMFTTITTIVFLRGVYAMEIKLRPSRWGKSFVSSSSPAEQARRDKRDLATLTEMWKMVSLALGFVGIGFAIWRLDQAFCPTLRGWRHEVGLPWGILLEGHGWWHIFTGIAEYLNLTWALWLRYSLDDKLDEVELVWPSRFGSVPVLEVRRGGKASGKRMD